MHKITERQYKGNGILARAERLAVSYAEYVPAQRTGVCATISPVEGYLQIGTCTSLQEKLALKRKFTGKELSGLEKMLKKRFNFAVTIH